MSEKIPAPAVVLLHFVKRETIFPSHIHCRRKVSIIVLKEEQEDMQFEYKQTHTHLR